MPAAAAHLHVHDLNPALPSSVGSSIGGVTGDGHDMHRPVWVKLSLVFPRRPDLPMPEQLPHPRVTEYESMVTP